MTDGLGEARIPIRAVLDKLDGDLAKARGKMDGALGKMAQTAKQIGTVALAGIATGVIAGGAALGTFAVKGINEFTAFQNQMNEVFTLLPDITNEAMDDMSDDVLQFSKDFAVLPNQVVPALYQSLSAGVPQDNVFSFLETAQKAAVGGITDLETSVDGITSVVNAYGEEVVNASEASDIMFTTVRLGKTDFTQLSKSLFNVIPTASSLGVSFEEVGAGMATLTAQGTPTSVATTQLRQLFIELSKSGGDLATVIEQETGKSFTDLIAEGQTVADVLNTVRDATDDQEFRELFSSVEAMNAALGVSGQNAELMQQNLDAMNESAGATDQAFERMNTGIERSKERFKAFVSASLIQVGDALSPIIDKGIELGEKVLPIVEDALHQVTGFLTGFFLGLENGDGVIKSLFDSLYEWTDLTVVAGEELDAVANLIENIIVPAIQEFKDRVIELMTPIIEAVTEFVSWKDILIVVAGSIMAVIIPAIFSLLVTIGQILLPIIAIIAIVATLRNAWENDWGGIATFFTDFWVNQIQPKLQELFDWLAVVLPEAIAMVLEAWSVAWPLIQQGLAIAWEVIKFILEAMWFSLINIIIPAIQELWNYWVNVAWPAISQALQTAWAFIKETFENLVEWVTGTLIPTVQDLHKTWSERWERIKTATRNVWYTVRTIFKEIGRWINDNIMPWVRKLQEDWSKDWNQAKDDLEAVWKPIKKVFDDFKTYLSENIPQWLGSAKKKWDEVFGGMEEKVSPVNDIIGELKQRVSDFWNFLSGHTFDFKISIPDLPDWAVPHSPLPIHTRWKEFGEYMNRTTIAPRVDMTEVDALARVDMTQADQEPTKSVSYSSETNIYTNQDPMRMLRTSRYLDNLEDL